MYEHHTRWSDEHLERLPSVIDDDSLLVIYGRKRGPLDKDANLDTRRIYTEYLGVNITGIVNAVQVSTHNRR
jgi:hypothetical protein